MRYPIDIKNYIQKCSIDRSARFGPDSFSVKPISGEGAWKKSKAVRNPAKTGLPLSLVNAVDPGSWCPFALPITSAGMSRDRLDGWAIRERCRAGFDSLAR